MALWSIQLCALLTLCGCATHVVWTGRDPARLVRAEVLAQGSKQWLRLGAVTSDRFDGIGTDGIVFAPDGSIAWPALRGGKWFMNASGKMLGPYDAVSDATFSPDGARLAFVAQMPDGFHAIVDETPSRAFEHIQAGTLQCSRNSAHFGFVGSEGKCARTVVDSVEGPCRDRVLSMRVTGAGTPVAVIRDPQGQRFALDELDPPFDEIGEWTMASNGRIAYAARSGARWLVTLDGLSSNKCARVQHLRFGDGGRRFGWVCTDQGLSQVVVDGARGPKYLSVSAPVLSDGSRDYAYIARDARGEWVIGDTFDLGPFAHASDLVLAKVGHAFAFVARASGSTRVVHNKTEIPIDAIVEGSLVLSENGEHWAAITGDAAKQTLFLTIDGVRRRQLVSSEVFGETAQFGPWLTRELHEMFP